MPVTSPDIAPAIPTEVSELAASCARFVLMTTGVPLDLTHETLPLLDHYVASAREELQSRPEAVPLIARAAGAYFGQVLALEFSGFWRVPSPDPHSWLLCMQPVFLALNPIGIGYEVLAGAASHAGPSAELKLAREDREPIGQRLAALPEVSERDYFTFSTRFDAIQVVVEALRAQMREGGAEDVTFELDDYLAEFGD